MTDSSGVTETTVTNSAYSIREGALSEVIDITLAAGQAQELEEGKRYAVIVPPGGGVQVLDNDLDDYRTAPRRQAGSHRVFDEPSFTGLVEDLRDADAPVRVYADPTKRSIVAVLNDAADGAPGWRDHRVELALIPTPEWSQWTAKDGQLQGQTDFAEFLEDHLSDVRVPAGAILLEVVLDLQATTGVTFEQGTRLADGQRQFVYREDTTATAGRSGELVVPEEFRLSLNPWQGTTAPIDVVCKLRFRTSADGLKIGYRLVNASRLLDEAFANIITTLRANGANVVLGAP